MLRNEIENDMENEIEPDLDETDNDHEHENNLLHIYRYLTYLTGSNCVQIETGKSSEYNKCFGCDTKDAYNCVQAMRNNVSGNVSPKCEMSKLNRLYESEYCCPKLGIDPVSGVLNLLFEGSAYPEAFQCLEKVGCSSSNVYKKLVDECFSVCPPNIYRDQNAQPACFAKFNSGQRINNFSYLNFHVVIALISIIVLISTRL